MKPWAQQFYKSKAWKECREGYIQLVHGLCERCNKKGKIVSGKIVHHKIILTPLNINDPNISLNWQHLEYVCQDCHNKEHFEKYSATRDGLAFDKNGDLVDLNATYPQTYPHVKSYPHPPGARG